MTNPDVPTGADASACAFEPTGLSLGADASQPLGHPGAWLFKACALDSHRPGPLTLFVPGHFTTLIEQASGMLLHPDNLVGSHTLMVILHVVPKGAADGVVPRTNNVVIGDFFVVATVLAVAVLAVRPDPRPYIECMPAKLRDFWSTGAQLPPHPPPA